MSNEWFRGKDGYFPMSIFNPFFICYLMSISVSILGFMSAWRYVVFCLSNNSKDVGVSPYKFFMVVDERYWHSINPTVSMVLQRRVFFDNRFSPCFVLPLKWLPVRWALSSTFKMHRPTKIFEWLNGSRPWWMIFCRVFWIVYNNTTPVHQNNVST